MADKPDTGVSTTAKWVVGTLVTLLVGGAGVVAILNWAKGETSCEVSGSLFDASTGQRIFGGEITYRDQAGSFHVLAESGNDGTFSTNCSGVPVGDFPLIVR